MDLARSLYACLIRERRADFVREMEAKGLVHWTGKEWITKEEFEKRYQALLDRGRHETEMYRGRLIQLYGKVPEWAPTYVRR